MDETKYSNDFKIRFDGELHQIDANILINSLLHLTKTIQEINASLNSGKKIEIKVKALEKSSFLVDIELLATAAESIKNLFTKENLEISAMIVTVLVGAIQLKKHLKGKKPKGIASQNSTTTIINQAGDHLIVDNSVYNIYFTNPIVRDSLSQNFESIQNDSSITAFEITDQKEIPLIRVEKNEFDFMTIKSEEINDNEKVTIEPATLYILRLSFEQPQKWDFYYKGNKISAKIQDPQFFISIDNGESFSKGDVLEVELQITQRFDNSVNTFINKSYQINKILKHTRRPEQTKLDLN